FFIEITATFRVFYVFVVTEVGTRRVRHWNVTEHPTAEWTAQQFRMLISGDEPHRFLIRDRDSIYSAEVDRTITAMGLTILKTPVRSPQTNAFLRTADWHNSARMSGLGHSVARGSPPKRPSRMGGTLQRRPSAHEPRVGHSRRRQRAGVTGASHPWRSP